MADRYWILGTGSWNATNTVNWSASSGGAGGASVPTASDNVFFDANSNVGTGAFTVTMADTPRVCNDFTASGLDGTMTLAGASIGLTVSGSLTFQATNFTRTYTGTTTFNATTTGKTVTTNGVAFGGIVTFNGVGGGWTLGSAFTTGTTITTVLTNGALNLDSYTLTTGVFSSSNSNIRTIAFGTGNITCTGTANVWNTLTTTNLTTTGTQVVNVTSVGSTGISINAGALSEANSISYNFTGGTYALTFLSVGSHSARNIDFTGYAGTWNDTSATNVFIYGDLKISSGMTLTAGTGTWTFGTTSGTKGITTSAKTIDRPIIFNGVGGTWQLQDALTMGSTRTATLVNGTIDLFGKTFTVGTRFVTNTGTKNLTFNGGTLICPDPNVSAFNNGAPINFTTTAGTGTGTISMTAATAKGFVGAGSTFNCTLNQGGAGALTITGSNTFSNITNTVQPASILFTAGTTTTFSNFSLSGTSGNLITIGSVTAASHTLSKASGTVDLNFLSISRSTATGGASWYAGANSTDGGNNSGWSFSAAPSASSGYPYGSGHYGIGPYNIGNLVLSGNASTGAVGDLLENISIQEDGNIATGNVGTVGINRTVAITGNSATGAVNSVLVSPIITGNAATGDLGTLSPEVISVQEITGVEGTEALGTAIATIEIAITGIELTGSVGTLIGFGWGAVPDTPESWTAQSDNSESWTPVADSSESWTPVSDTSENWSDLADNSVTWQEAA